MKSRDAVRVDATPVGLAENFRSETRIFLGDTKMHECGCRKVLEGFG